MGWQTGHRLVTKWAGADGFVLAASGPARYVIRAPLPDVPLVTAALASGPVVDARPLLTQIPAGGTPTTPEGMAVPLPAPFQEGPALAGWTLSADAVAPGQALTPVTFWRIDGALVPPLAVFVHLLGDDGLPLTQWDGWPVATDGLEPGDVVVLSHPLQVPEGTAAGRYTLQVGLYRPPTGPWLPVAGTDRLILTQVKVAP